MKNSLTTICICGGGSLGHVIVGTAVARGFRVNLLSPRAETWDEEITVHACDGKIFRGRLSRKSADAKKVVPNADFVLLCVPGYLIRPTLEEISGALSAGTPVGSVVSSSGFFFAAREILPAGTPLFGFQRVPYIARVEEYGNSAELLGYKNELNLAAENFAPIEGERFRERIETLFATPTRLLESFWDAALTNSNPLLHPCRLYGMWKDWDGKSVFRNCPRFYEDWDDFSSETLLSADEEFFTLLDKLPATPGAIPRLRDYYESPNASALTRKLRSIPAFRKILAPMVRVPDGFIPDIRNRYFTEDIPFGMQIIKNLAVEFGVETPTINKILKWAGRLPPPSILKRISVNKENELFFPQYCRKEVA